MNRRRFQQSKPFISGGFHNNQNGSNGQQYQQQNQQLNVQPQRTPQRNQRNYQATLQQNYQEQKKEPEIIEESKPEEVVEEEIQQNDDEMANIDDNQSNEKDDSTELTDKNGKMRFKKIFLIRKKSSVRAREKKIRQNRQLRKAIMPKNALMALNEVKGIQMSDFVVNNNPSGGFTAVVTVNNNQYEGRGNSKASAKNNACEKALRDYVIAKMVRKPRKPKVNSESNVEPMDAEDDDNADKDQSKDSENGEEQDDVPMVNLASFALFKLFSEWENEGYVVPEMHPAVPNGGTNGTVSPKEPKKLPVRNELPNNWESMHPATLLCMMRPGITYSDCGTIGEKPNVMQKVSLVVDDKEFSGFGRSKKIARRNAAASVCNSLFGTNFNEELAADA